MPQYKEKPTTFTADQWTGENFEFFKKTYPAASHIHNVLDIPLWIEADKRWQNHKAYKDSWVVINNLTDKMEVLSPAAFEKRFTEVKK